MDIPADFPAPYQAGSSEKYFGNDFLAGEGSPNRFRYGHAVHNFKYCFYSAAYVPMAVPQPLLLAA